MTDSNQQGLFDTESGDAAITLGRYAEQAYLDYAVSVVRGRALPDVGDGQKPVQRRILYAMQAMGLGPTAKPVKSARVVGDVLGKYHPHGDQAAYDAMVRMAQGFTLRYPLVDGQGNFGSRDGDNAAAMRYTEARLTPIARVLLDELEEGTVDFIPNYDGSYQEPQMLPARLPMMLLNGASGIAVGMATEIPPHNLREVAQACVALLKQPQLPDDDLYALVPGPDFAGGGQIITPSVDIAQIYNTGRGSLKARARWQFEELARGQWQLVVTELPPGASCQRVLEEIEELTNPKIKAGKKALSAEQQQAKAQMLALLDAVRDESGKDCSTPCATNRARMPRCAWSSNPRPRASTATNSSTSCWPRPAWKTAFRSIWSASAPTAARARSRCARSCSNGWRSARTPSYGVPAIAWTRSSTASMCWRGAWWST
jgi:topoisomerase-4 subunit A